MYVSVDPAWIGSGHLMAADLEQRHVICGWLVGVAPGHDAPSATLQPSLVHWEKRATAAANTCTHTSPRALSIIPYTTATW